jgi:hypothetical protein
MNQNPTIGDAYDALTSAVTDYASEGIIVSEQIEIFNLAIQADVNFRDLLMGLPKHYAMDTCIGFVSYVIGQVHEQERTPYLTILSAYSYELNDNKSAWNLLKSALEIHSDYSLANLLKRMYVAGWSPESLAGMRNSLDDKVRAVVEEQRDVVISEIANA